MREIKFTTVPDFFSNLTECNGSRQFSSREILLFDLPTYHPILEIKTEGLDSQLSLSYPELVPLGANRTKVKDIYTGDKLFNPLDIENGRDQENTFLDLSMLLHPFYNTYNNKNRIIDWLVQPRLELTIHSIGDYVSTQPKVDIYYQASFVNDIKEMNALTFKSEILDNLGRLAITINKAAHFAHQVQKIWHETSKKDKTILESYYTSRLRVVIGRSNIEQKRSPRPSDKKAVTGFENKIYDLGSKFNAQQKHNNIDFDCLNYSIPDATITPEYHQLIYRTPVLGGIITSATITFSSDIADYASSV